MLKTVWAIVRQGKIELLEPTEIPEGARILVTFYLMMSLNFGFRQAEYR
jgi:hypothetical protein